MRKLLPLASLGYTVALLYLSLIKVSDVVELPNNSDKVIHAIAYFIFTSLWFLTLYFSYNKKITQALIVSVTCSVIFGIVIEILQQTTTQNRQGDYKDVIANIIGTLVAVVIIKFITILKVKN